MAVNPIDEARKAAKPYLPAPAPAPNSGERLRQVQTIANAGANPQAFIQSRAPTWSPEDMKQRNAALDSTRRIAAEGAAADKARAGSAITKTTSNGVNSYSGGNLGRDPGETARINAQIDAVTTAGLERQAAAQRTTRDGTPISGGQAGARARGGLPMSQTQAMPANGGAYEATNSTGFGYNQLKPEDSVGTFNGRTITKAESDARAGTLPTGNPFEEGVARRGTTPMQGYVGGNRSTSKGVTADDKRVLEMDLRSVGRGSPSVRAGLMARYNAKAGNAEQGQNSMAEADLNATARSADGFAERSQAGQQFDAKLDQDATQFGEKLALERRGTENQGDYLKMLQDDAKARRDDDQFNLQRRGVQDKDTDERVDKYVTEGMTRDQAQAARAGEIIKSGQDLQSTSDVLGAGTLAQAPLDALGEGVPWYSDALEGRNPFRSNAQTPKTADYDLSQVSGGARENQLTGMDASTVNWLLPGFLELDEYQAEGQSGADGTQIRRTFPDKAAYEQFTESLNTGKAAQEALRRRNAAAGK